MTSYYDNLMPVDEHQKAVRELENAVEDKLRQIRDNLEDAVAEMQRTIGILNDAIYKTK